LAIIGPRPVDGDAKFMFVVCHKFILFEILYCTKDINFLDTTFREGILLGYGNPLLDISVNGTVEFLDK